MRKELHHRPREQRNDARRPNSTDQVGKWLTSVMKVRVKTDHQHTSSSSGTLLKTKDEWLRSELSHGGTMHGISREGKKESGVYNDGGKVVSVVRLEVG